LYIDALINNTYANHHVIFKIGIMICQLICRDFQDFGLSRFWIVEILIVEILDCRDFVVGLMLVEQMTVKISYQNR
jgi:hypothetical protein